MVDTDLMRLVSGIIGNVISVGMFASAVPTFYRVAKNKCVEDDVKPDYYLSMMFTCLVLVLYALPFFHPGNILLLTAYGTGLIINLAYLTIFLLYNSRQRMYVGSLFLTGLLVIGLGFGLVFGLAHTFETRSTYVGLIYFFTSVIMLTLRLLLTEGRRTKCMPFLITLGETLNGLCWSIYAACLPLYDVHLVVSNVLGFACGLCLLVYLVYTSPKSCADEELGHADEELAQAIHDRKLARNLDHDKLKQAPELARAQLAQFEQELGPVTGLAQDELDI